MYPHQHAAALKYASSLFSHVSGINISYLYDWSQAYVSQSGGFELDVNKLEINRRGRAR